MQTPEPIPTDALLLLVSDDGIPLLVRTYGLVSTPPSAVVGVVSALYHAAQHSNSSAELLNLEAKHRSVVYEKTSLNFLLVFASEKPCNGCDSSNAMTRRMLRTVFRTLLLLLGEQNLRDWDVSKQRVAVTKQAKVVDAIVNGFWTDPRFIFGRPVRDVLKFVHLESTEVGQEEELLQGAWLQGETLMAEYFKHGGKALNASELLSVIVLAECVGRRDTNYTHHVARIFEARLKAHVKVVIRNSSRGPLVTFIGVFSDEMQDNNALREKADRLLPLHSKARTKAQASDQLTGLPKTLICSYASRVGDVPSPSCRTLSYLNPSWETIVAAESARLNLPMNAKKIPQGFWWRELCRFAAHRQETASSMATWPSDFKQEDEALTFLQHVRGPIQYVSLCVGPVQVADMMSLGDAIASAMLGIQ